jgi:hypothetical protein
MNTTYPPVPDVPVHRDLRELRDLRDLGNGPNNTFSEPAHGAGRHPVPSTRSFMRRGRVHPMTVVGGVVAIAAVVVGINFVLNPHKTATPVGPGPYGVTSPTPYADATSSAPALPAGDPIGTLERQPPAAGAAPATVSPPPLRVPEHVAPLPVAPIRPHPPLVIRAPRNGVGSQAPRDLYPAPVRELPAPEPAVPAPAPTVSPPPVLVVPLTVPPTVEQPLRTITDPPRGRDLGRPDQLPPAPYVAPPPTPTPAQNPAPAAQMPNQTPAPPALMPNQATTGPGS